MDLKTHKRLGKELKEVIWILLMAMDGRAGLSQKRIVGLEKRIDRIRSMLDTVLCAEHPGISDEEFFKVYYCGKDSASYWEGKPRKGISAAQKADA